MTSPNDTLLDKASMNNQKGGMHLLEFGTKPVGMQCCDQREGFKVMNAASKRTTATVDDVVL
jgi:hypothetical protein